MICLRDPKIFLDDFIKKNYYMTYHYEGDAKVLESYEHGDKIVKLVGDVYKTIKLTIGFKYNKAESTEIAINDLLGGKQFGGGEGVE